MLIYMPDHVINQILQYINYLVPMIDEEARKTMQVYLTTWFPVLEYPHKNDKCYFDTIFASIESIYELKFWNLFYYKKFKLDVVMLMCFQNQ